MVMMLTPEQFETMTARFVAMGAAQRQPTDREKRQKLRARDLETQDFDGSVSAWGNWSLGFKVMVKRQNPEISDLLLEAERIAGEATYETFGRADTDDDEFKTMCGEIYSLFCQCCAGDAMTVLRGTPDCQGFLAC